MTTPVLTGPSGSAPKAANSLPSAALSVRSSCETAAPLITGMGGEESSSKHMRRRIRESDGVHRASERPIAEERDERGYPGAARAAQRPAIDRSRIAAPAGRRRSGTGAGAAERPALADLRQVTCAP